MMKYDKSLMEKLPFIDFLKKIQALLDDFGYSGPLDNALYQGQDLGQHVIERYISEYNADPTTYFLEDDIANNIKVDVQILNHYNFNGNQRSKKDVLEDFRQNLQTDVGELISRIEDETPVEE